ncbi:MAG: L-threonylcarbamoyladenylate synthase [Pseudomonadota bacterium]
MTDLVTEHFRPDDAGTQRAAAILRSGGLVAFPTETVYGLGADACNDLAVARVFEAKGRPRFNPLIVHVPDFDAARSYGSFGPAAERLAQAFWPGPLTLVVPTVRGAPLSELVTAGLASVAVRVPEHPLARDLLTVAARPVAAPSANPSGRVSPTTAKHVADGLNGRIDAILDGGACPVGLESTIVGFEGGVARLLRPGGLPIEAIEACIGSLLPPAVNNEGAITAPGQLASHYAPDAPLRLGATEMRDGEVFLGFGPVAGTLSLSPAGDLLEAAANLYAHLRTLDDMGAAAGIAVAPIPEIGLGRAINDRLRRAAAPRT